jgi:hypothetical protein
MNLPTTPSNGKSEAPLGLEQVLQCPFMAGNERNGAPFVLQVSLRCDTPAPNERDAEYAASGTRHRDGGVGSRP